MVYIAVAIIILVIVLYALRSSCRSNNSPPLPPGPTPIPLFGNLLSLGKLPHLTVAEYVYKHREQRVTSMYFGSTHAVFLNDPAIMLEAYVTKGKNFSSRPRTSSLQIATYADKNHYDMAFANGEVWKRYRRVMAAAFTKTKVKTFKGCLAEELVEFDKQLQQIAKINLPVDFHFYTKRYALNILQRIAFGSTFSYSNEEDNNRSVILIKQIEIIFDLLGPTDYISDYVPALSFVDIKKKKRLRHEIDAALEAIGTEVEKHKKNLDPSNPKDVLDAMLVESSLSSDSKLYNDQDILLMSLDLYLAGTDTSSTTVDWFLYMLARFPEYQDKLFAEISQAIGPTAFPSYSTDLDKTPLLKATINEAQRLRPVGPFSLPRLADADEILAGYSIPKNTTLFWNNWGYNHDEAVWGDANMFRPERFLEPNAPQIYIFGAGPRMCIGSTLAEEEIYQICALICQRYTIQFEKPQAKLDDGVFAMVLRPNPYKLIFAPR